MVEVPNVTWEDIGGLENVKRELQELVQVSAALLPILLQFWCAEIFEYVHWQESALGVHTCGQKGSLVKG